MPRRSSRPASPASRKPAEVSPDAIRAAAASVPAGRQGLLHFADAIDGLSAVPDAETQVPELHLVTFQLDREEFGIPIGQAREVVRVALYGDRKSVV